MPHHIQDGVTECKLYLKFQFVAIKFNLNLELVLPFIGSYCFTPVERNIHWNACLYKICSRISCYGCVLYINAFYTQKLQYWPRG